jgi:hypothetical protein
MTIRGSPASENGWRSGAQLALLIGGMCIVAAAVPIAGQESRSAIAAPATEPLVPQGTSSVRGHVRDSVGKPIPYATVVWGAARQVITTTDSGTFELHDIPSVTTRFTVRRLGYVPVDFDLTLKPRTLKPVIVNLTPVAAPLSEVAVETHSDFDSDDYRAARFAATGFVERMARSPGYFIPPAEVERRRPAYVSDLLYSVPGVTMVGRPHTASLHYLSSSQRCRMQLYLDGHPAIDGDDLVPGSDIKAVEVYTSLTSAADKFLPSPLKGFCGSIVIWTR